MKKIKVAFIKFGGLSSAGTEKWLQLMAANLPKDQFEVHYYYSDVGAYRSFFKVPDNYSFISPHRKQILLDKKIPLFEFNVASRLTFLPTLDFSHSNFWEVFDETKYDIIQTAKSGPPEYPFYLFKKPVVEFISLPGSPDHSRNVVFSIHLSEWQRNIWLNKGGSKKLSSIIPIPVDKPLTKDDLRKELGIPKDSLVLGFHQRPDNNIFSPMPLKAFSELNIKNSFFVLLGGGLNYRIQAKKLGLKNVIFLNPNSDSIFISKFLNTLDIYCHGRKDGETFGVVLAEAMMHKKPCLTHKGSNANAQKDTIGPGGFFAENFVEYKKYLLKLSNDKKLRNSLGKKGYAFALKNYSLDSCVKSLSDIYRNIVNNKEDFFRLKSYYSSYKFLFLNKGFKAIFLKFYFSFFVFLSKFFNLLRKK